MEIRALGGGILEEVILKHYKNGRTRPGDVNITLSLMGVYYNIYILR